MKPESLPIRESRAQCYVHILSFICIILVPLTFPAVQNENQFLEMSEDYIFDTLYFTVTNKRSTFVTWYFLTNLHNSKYRVINILSITFTFHFDFDPITNCQVSISILLSGYFNQHCLRETGVS